MSAETDSITTNFKTTTFLRDPKRRHRLCPVDNTPSTDPCPAFGDLVVGGQPSEVRVGHAESLAPVQVPRHGRVLCTPWRFPQPPVRWPPIHKRHTGSTVGPSRSDNQFLTGMLPGNFLCCRRTGSTMMPVRLGIQTLVVKTCTAGPRHTASARNGTRGTVGAWGERRLRREQMLG